MKKGLLIVLGFMFAIVFTITVPAAAGNLKKQDREKYGFKDAQVPENSTLQTETGRETRKHNVELEGQERKKYEEMMREKRKNQKELTQEEKKSYKEGEKELRKSQKAMEREEKHSYKDTEKEQRKNMKEMAGDKEKEGYGDIKGEEGRAKARDRASDKGQGEKKGRPWWNFWGKEEVSQ